MKPSASLCVSDYFSQLEAYDAIIDVRSPAEFEEDHIPGAINCPVLDNEERKKVGTIYKQISPFEAKKVGAALVAKNIAAHIEARFLDHPRSWTPLIYCWRGGNRSGAMTHILTKIGWHAQQLEGGYKNYRREVNAALAEFPRRFTYRVICGTTGSGKSRLLQTLATKGAQVLDLEQLAAHRGSVLGHLPSEPQPSQKAFESRILDRLRHFDPGQAVFIESESKKVGNLRVPDALMDSMRSSECISLELPRASRVRLLMEDYAHFVQDPAILNVQLDRLADLHGRARIVQWQALSVSGKMAELVEELLANHYDPLYLRSIGRNFKRIQQAQVLSLTDIGPDDFRRTARSLLSA